MTEHFPYRHEDDGTLARFVCPCGWKSGLLPRNEAAQLANEHAECAATAAPTGPADRKAPETA